MELRYAFVADSANTTQDGRVNAVGIFQNINAPQYPWVHPSLTLVICFEVKPSDFGTTRDILVRLITADGVSVHEQRMIANVPKKDAFVYYDRPGLNFMWNFLGLRFEHPGTYEFAIEVNTNHMVSIPLNLVPAPGR